MAEYCKLSVSTKGWGVTFTLTRECPDTPEDIKQYLLEMGKNIRGIAERENLVSSGIAVE